MNTVPLHHVHVSLPVGSSHKVTLFYGEYPNQRQVALKHPNANLFQKISDANIAGKLDSYTALSTFGLAVAFYPR